MSDTLAVALALFFSTAMMFVITLWVIRALLSTQAVLLKQDRREQHMAERVMEKMLARPVEHPHIDGLHASERSTEAHDDALTERSNGRMPPPVPPPIVSTGSGYNPESVYT